ncbi:MAG: Trk system potassium transporter TrkA [Tissierellia bacterium]|nr:Trk system potassium transporter TrkA [Tissierellia bacterium]
MKAIIIGAGKLGSRLADIMNVDDYDITLVDNNPAVVNRLNEHMDVITIQGNGTDINFLKDIDVGSTDVLITTTGNDEANAMICYFAKKLGCKLTIARMRDMEYLKQSDFLQENLSVDYIINPDQLTAEVIAKYLLRDVIFFTGDFAEGKVKMVDLHLRDHPELVDKQLMELKAFRDLLVVAIQRQNETIIPHGGTVLQEDDVIHVLGKDEDIKLFINQFSLAHISKPVKKAMILGGGKVGTYLALALIKAGVATTIIEKDYERIKFLAEHVEHALIIQGDGTDMNLLEEEDIGCYNAFVGVTGMDEQNLLMAIMAKQYGVPKTVAKTSRQNYSRIIDKFPVDAAISPVSISVAQILKYLRGGTVISLNLMLGGDAQVLEIIATPGMPFIGKRLADLPLEKGIIVGTIIHDGIVSIAKGQSIIRAGDKVILFVLTSQAEQMKKMFIPSNRSVLHELWDRAKSIR